MTNENKATIKKSKIYKITIEIETDEEMSPALEAELECALVAQLESLDEEEIFYQSKYSMVKER